MHPFSRLRRQLPPEGKPGNLSFPPGWHANTIKERQRPLQMVQALYKKTLKKRFRLFRVLCIRFYCNASSKAFTTAALMVS